jgi:hypothetical protein
LQGWQGLSDGKADEKQLLKFPQREVFRPAPQPAVGAVQAGPQRYSTLAANDTARPRRHGRYNWDGRYVSQAAVEPEGPSLGRRVLLPAGALALLAGVALGAFYLMHTFGAGPDAVVANTAAPAKVETTVAAVAQVPAATAQTPKAGTATAQGASERITAPTAAAKTAAIAPKGAAVAAVKVPAPDNERWGDDAADAKVAAASQPQAEKADAASEVNDPQSAPVPTEEPKMATSEAEAPKAVAEAPKTEVSKTVAEAPKKLAYASPSQAAHPVDKAVTAALPQAASTSGETALPGVNADPLSVPAKASAGEASDSAGGSDTAGGYASTVHTAVKLHAGPSNGSRSIGVVPGKATVHVLNCKGWCKVSYAGKEGYIFKSFLGRASAPAPAVPQKSAAAPAAPVAPAAQNAAAKPAAPAPADAQALEAASERTMMRR